LEILDERRRLIVNRSLSPRTGGPHRRDDDAGTCSGRAGHVAPPRHRCKAIVAKIKRRLSTRCIHTTRGGDHHYTDRFAPTTAPAMTRHLPPAERVPPPPENHQRGRPSVLGWGYDYALGRMCDTRRRRNTFETFNNAISVIVCQ